MSASAPDRSSLAPVAPFATDSPLTRAPVPPRPGVDGDEAPKRRRVTSKYWAPVRELEPHWLETIDSATD